ISAFACLFIIYSLLNNNFLGFCIGLIIIGSTFASMQQYRFAAIESVRVEKRAQAISVVLISGIAAAFLGPELALIGKDWFETRFVGSFALMAGTSLFSALLLLCFKNIRLAQLDFSNPPRSMCSIVQQLGFWVAIISGSIGFGIMTFVMSATPISMHIQNGHSLEMTKIVMQAHIATMFLPSLVTSWIVARISIEGMMAIGCIAYLASFAVAYDGHTAIHYITSLSLLGIGWNFLFIGGTLLLPQFYLSNERFKVQSLNDFSIFTTQAATSVFAGLAIFNWGWHVMLAISTIITFLFVIFLGYYQWRKLKSLSQ
ncbi:MAG: MFS transporter, partial [Methylobacter sp.]